MISRQDFTKPYLNRLCRIEIRSLGGIEIVFPKIQETFSITCNDSIRINNDFFFPCSRHKIPLSLYRAGQMQQIAVFLHHTPAVV